MSVLRAVLSVENYRYLSVERWILPLSLLVAASFLLVACEDGGALPGVDSGQAEDVWIPTPDVQSDPLPPRDTADDPPQDIGDDEATDPDDGSDDDTDQDADDASDDGSVDDVEDADDPGDSEDDPEDDVEDTDDPDDAEDSEDDAEDVANPSTYNECGGRGSLSYRGTLARPGSQCGTCGDGTLVCDGSRGLRCIGASERNACGTCGGLAAEPGDSCGDCGDGVYVCSGSGVVCDGASQENLCGGCAPIGLSPGSTCVIDVVTTGVWVCESDEELSCQPSDTGNLCGGDGPTLYNGQPAFPGGACESECGEGVLVCDGAEELRCSGAPEPNECGGCDLLPAAAGDDCGVCGGEWVCEDGGLVCEGDEHNECGGCQTLDGVVGTLCEGVSAYYCAGLDELGCRAPQPNDNACGGTDVLDGRPGEPCGACGAGTYACDGPDSVQCIETGAPMRNECGGCELLPAPVGSPCGACATGEYVCDGEEALSCDGDAGDDALNRCGGCALIDDEDLGCGPCDEIICDGLEPRCSYDPQPLCAGALSCDLLSCDDEFRVCVEGSEEADAFCGDCIEDYIVGAGGLCVPSECEIDADCPTPEAEEWSECSYATTCSWDGSRSRTAYRGVCEAHLCVEPTSYTETEDCERDTDLEPCAGGVCNEEACEGPPEPPYGVRASTDSYDSVTVGWDIPDHGWITGVELQRDNDPSFIVDVEDGSYTDLTAPAGSVSVCSVPVVNTGRSDGILLNCDVPQQINGMPVSWSVRFVNPAGVSAWRFANGQRIVGFPEITWQRRLASEPGAWFDIDTDFSSLGYLDESASPGVEYFYRAMVSAEGAETVYSGERSGVRMAPPADPPAGFLASTNRQENIRLTWTAGSGNLRYEVQIGDGDWEDVGRVNFWDHTDAPEGVYTECTPSATFRTVFDVVELSCPGGSVGPSEPVTYRLRARNDAGPGPSAVATGHRAAPTMQYRWRYRLQGGGWFDIGQRSSNHEYIHDGLDFQQVAEYQMRLRLEPPPRDIELEPVEGAPRNYAEITTNQEVGVTARSLTWMFGYRLPGGMSRPNTVRGFCLSTQPMSCPENASSRCPSGATMQEVRTSAGPHTETYVQQGLQPRQEVWMCPFIEGVGGEFIRGETISATTSDVLLGEVCFSSSECDSGFCANGGYCGVEGFTPIRTSGRSIGSQPSYSYREEDEPLRTAGISRHYFMQNTEATRAEWLNLMGVDPSEDMADCGGDCPVENITWWDALEYANARSAAEGVEACYNLTGCTGTAGAGRVCTGYTINSPDGSPLSCEGYRLPTESEWEIAYRADGSISHPIYGYFLEKRDCDEDPTLSLNARTCANSSVSASWCVDFEFPGIGGFCGGPAPVGSYEPGGYGLYDMAGNVREWTWDAYTFEPLGVDDYTGPGGSPTSNRVVKGGSWRTRNLMARGAFREPISPTTRSNDLGVRLARTSQVQIQ